MRFFKRIFPRWFVSSATKGIWFLKTGRILWGTRIGFKTKLEKAVSIQPFCDITGSEIGYGTYIAGKSRLTQCKIGRFCSIGEHVMTRLGQHPLEGIVSTHPAFYLANPAFGVSFTAKDLFNPHQYLDEERKFLVRIGSDVWIGNNVSILDGITIGDGAVIATGSVVTKDVEPYSIVGGLPAKHIRHRFTPEQRETLLYYRWWDQTIPWIQEHAHLFQDIEKFIEFIEQSPKEA